MGALDTSFSMSPLEGFACMKTKDVSLHCGYKSPAVNPVKLSNSFLPIKTLAALRIQK